MFFPRTLPSQNFFTWILWKEYYLIISGPFIFSIFYMHTKCLRILWMTLLSWYFSLILLTVIIPLCRLPPVAEGVDPPGTDEKVESILTTSRAAYEKLRQRATVLKVAREQGWHVAKELATLQDQEEDPLLKKAIKNASRRYTIIIIFFSATFFVSHTFFIFFFTHLSEIFCMSFLNISLFH